MTATALPPRPRVAVVGGGPAGLMAAQVLAAGGAEVDLFDAMPSVGRKFLLAGRGGLNLTHSEPAAAFIERYAERAATLRPLLQAFGADDVRRWSEGLGVPTFVGSSGRVFPVDFKAAPLLRAWLHRLREAGVRLHARHRCIGLQPGPGGVGLRFQAEGGTAVHQADAVVLALGGASWARLGSDGAWVPWLQALGGEVAPLRPSNCGFDVAPTAEGRAGWSDLLRTRYAGQPLKTVAATLADTAATPGQPWLQGECVVTATGIEGSLVYAFSQRLRARIAAEGEATWLLDLLPQHTPAQVLAEASRPRGPRSLSTHLKSRLGLQGLKMALLHELLSPAQLADPRQLAAALKALPLRLLRPRPIDEAISTAGGVRFESLDERLMLRSAPGVFCAGEMLDWEAPTGGYLLTAALSTGHAAALGLLQWLRTRAVG